MSVPMSALHELACTGPTPEQGCVCAHPPARRRPSIVAIHLDAAAENRQRAAELVDGIEKLLDKFAALPAVPLDVLDRMERLIVAAHTSNLLRLPQYGDLRGDE